MSLHEARVYRVAVVTEGDPQPTLCSEDITGAIAGEFKHNGAEVVAVHVEEVTPHEPVQHAA